MKKIRVLDAFSGIGGFRKGIELSNNNDRHFSFIGASDTDELCKKVYELSYDTHDEDFFNDIGLIHTSVNKTGTYAKDFDLFVAGFPCQPFANIGHRKGLNDERGTLIFKICDLLKFYQPKYFILENVQKIKNLGKGSTLEIIKNLLKESGYSFCLWDLCASNYGVPQQRRRMIFCGVKNNNPEELMLPPPKIIKTEEREYKTTWHLLEKTMHSEHIVPKQTAKTVFRKNEKWQGDLKINRLEARPLTATMAKWHRANQDNYFSEDFVFSKNVEEASQCNSYPNGKLVRRISLLEGLRLQGFDKEIHNVFNSLNIKPTAGYRLIGNAIPVPLVKSITDSFFKYF